MKRIISLVLTLVMLASVAIIPTGAADNAAIVYNKAGVIPATNWFIETYSYTSLEGIKRVADPDSEFFGGYNYTHVLDFKVTDYAFGDKHNTDFTFSGDVGRWHAGYSFTEKAFVVYDLYMNGSDPAMGYHVLDSMSYELEVDKWYELALRAVGDVISIYLNGIEMLSCSLCEEYDEEGINFGDGWEEAKKNPGNYAADYLFFSPVDVDITLDNLAFYSGDYDIATGKASETYLEPDGDFVGSEDSGVFATYKTNEENQYGNEPRMVYSATGGTDKVTYDREAAAAHVHEWGVNKELSQTVGCLNPGYDLFECKNGCGAAEKQNYVEPLGHMPGYMNSEPIKADAENSGVQERQCTREGCGMIYKTISPLTDSKNGALYAHTAGGASFYEGFLSVLAKEIHVLEKGINVTFDIMPLKQTEGKNFAAIGATLGGNGYNYWVGYSYKDAAYLIKLNEEIIAKSDAPFDNYSWYEWSFVYNTETMKLDFYVDGKVILSADIPVEAIDPSNLAACYDFTLRTPACELIIDNLLVAAPDFDRKSNTGVVYTYLTFNGDCALEEGFYYDPLVNNQVFCAIAYDALQKAGYTIEPYGRPGDVITRAHADRAILVDSDYASGSTTGYAQLLTLEGGETEGTDYMKEFVNSMNFEISYDIYAYDWCTDDALLNGASATIGTHVNSFGKGDEVNIFGNLFAGYDFSKQQVVIGACDGQVVKGYSDNTKFADYAIAKETWHRMTIKYEYKEAENLITVSVSMNGKVILTQDFDYDYVTVSYLVFYAGYVKAYLDEFDVSINGVVYDEGVDFTNKYDTAEVKAMDFTGAAYSVADGGKPTHAYTAEEFPASCLTDGYTNYSCSCGESDYTLYNLPATGHNYDEGIVTVEPSGTAEGEMTYTCLLCGEKKVEKIEKLFTYGDVDNDGAINNKDVTALTRKVKGAEVTINLDAADVNGDGAVNNSDLTLLTRKVKGAEVEFGA